MSLETIRYAILIAAITGLAHAQNTLSLQDATRRALAQNRTVLEAELAVQVKENESLAAKTRRWPGLSTSAQAGPLLNRPDLTFTAGALGNFPATGPIPASNTTIRIPRNLTGFGMSQLSMPLTQQWRLGSNIRQSMEETEATKADAEQIRVNIAARVRTLYFQLVALSAAQRVAKAQAETAEEVARLARKTQESGNALPADVSRAEAHLAQAKVDAANVDTDLADGQEQLNFLMGEPLDAHFALSSEEIKAPGGTLEAAREQALSARPEIKAARLRLDEAHLGVRSKRLEQIPDLNFTVSDVYFLNTNNYLPSQIAAAGLSLSWEPWDWGRKQHEAAALRAKEEQQRLAVTQLEQQIRLETDRAWREYQRAQRNWQAAQTETQSNEEQLRVAKERYAKQAALLREVLEAQTSWAAAGQAEARALAALGTAWADLQAAMGNE